MSIKDFFSFKKKLTIDTTAPKELQGLSLFSQENMGKAFELTTQKLQELLNLKDVPGRKEIVDRFHITNQEFNVLYASYYGSLFADHGTEGGWNEDCDDFAREIGSYAEIENAKKNLHLAILNRIKLRFISSDKYAKAARFPQRLERGAKPFQALMSQIPLFRSEDAVPVEYAW